MDKDVAKVKEFIYQVMIPKVEAGEFEMITDYKTHLQELLQVNGDVAIRYQVISETGPAHDKVFDVEVLVEGKSIGQGQGRSKKLAEQEAAKNAVEKGLDSCI
ncbi:Ribonuclease III [Streptococcus mitis]|uniref:Ribonuclease III n=1 Tax=Streptococcus mitis TaxID=28037 RepID=A0A139RA91_STRMT|nr:Ribonuclease III [Streptococcus mitis]